MVSRNWSPDVVGEGITMNPLSVDFGALLVQAGSLEGARKLFERLVIQLMRLQYKDATGVKPKQGDWGIDCFAGDLVDGSVVVWQAKYFVHGVGNSGMAQIRDSFAAVLGAAQEHRFHLVSWKLCLPCQLTGPEHKWWETWRKKQMKATGIDVGLLDEDGLRSLLLNADARHLLYGAFGPSPTWLEYFLSELRKGTPERDILMLPDPGLFDEAMFVRQLRAARVAEMQSAKTSFFNAELLTQEVLDQAEPERVKHLGALTEKVRAMWEARFLQHYATLDNAQLFYGGVMRDIEQQAETSLACPASLAATFIHKQGVCHQLADRVAIGWIPDFRERFRPPKDVTA